jgi:hypothetical protein
LRSIGREDLAPKDNKRRPLSSRVAELRNRGGTDQQVRDLMKIWGEWRVQ